MAKTSYTAADIENLKRANPSLDKPEVEKYAKYKSMDPFPYIDAALLNSADLLKYLLTVGIIDPFDEKKLKGVTYQCTFSGEAHLYNPESQKMEKIQLGDEEKLELEKNSITYLKIEEKFHVPEYMVLRFNLSVSNAYKGLLLGTGPIVDPGFQGNLFIPLHNLTGNKYTIKKGAPLIRVEFTKLSHHADWKSGKANLFPPIKPITKETPQNASFSQFIEEALRDTGKGLFYASGGADSVRSSIPEIIAVSANKAEEAQVSAKNAADEAQKSANAAAKMSVEVKKKMQKWSIAGSIIGVITLIITVIGILHSSYSLIQDTNVRFDGIVQELETCKQQISVLTQQLEEAQEQLDLYETEQPRNTEQSTTTAISDEAEAPSSVSRGETDGDDGP